MSVRIVTDSTAQLPAELVARHGITVVPLHVILDGDDRLEGVDVTPDEIATAMRERVPVSTSRPAPEAFALAYGELVEQGATHIVSVHLSEKLSGTAEAARLGGADAGVPVEVIDSETIGMGLGLSVLAGVAALESGADADGVAEAIRSTAAASSTWLCVDTLEHLRRGGRIGAASALVGTALAIKPILAVREGRIVPLEKVRTRSRAIARLEALALEGYRKLDEPVDVAIHEFDAMDRALEVMDRLRAELPAAAVRVVELGAVAGAHVGPGSIGIAVAPGSGLLGAERAPSIDEAVDEAGESPADGATRGDDHGDHDAHHDGDEG